MSQAKALTHKTHKELSETVARANEQHDSDSKTLFGFWVYLMTDCVLFASLFAVYAVLHTNTFGGPGARQLFNLHYALIETMILLTSSFSCGLGILAARTKNKTHVLLWLSFTMLLGFGFLGMELHEFINFVHMGDSWRRSGFLSSYFTLVATHGLHITVGLLWIIVMLFRISKSGITRHTTRQLTLLSLFWHFLDVIWIFIFSVVYLMGGIGV
jgi:cytochrome o ubiquinol oxidase subunit 3